MRIMTRLLILGSLLTVIAARGTDSPDPVETRPLQSFQFISQDGKKFTLGDIAHDNLVVSFVFTSCPMPKMCPMTLSVAKDAIEAWENLPRLMRWLKPIHVLAVTIDPERDTPAVLKAWTEKHGLKDLPFTFATGDPAQITAFAARFNVVAFPSEGTIAHNVRTVVLNHRLDIAAEFRDNEEDLGKPLTGKAVVSALPIRPGRLLMLSGALVIIAALGSAIIKRKQRES